MMEVMWKSVNQVRSVCDQPVEKLHCKGNQKKVTLNPFLCDQADISLQYSPVTTRVSASLMIHLSHDVNSWVNGDSLFHVYIMVLVLGLTVHTQLEALVVWVDAVCVQWKVLWREVGAQKEEVGRDTIIPLNISSVTSGGELMEINFHIITGTDHITQLK